MFDDPDKSKDHNETVKLPRIWFRRDCFYLVIILLGLGLFFKEALAGRRTLVWDAADYFYPFFFTASEALREWRLPLWTPYLFNGFPILANIEAQIFYPLNLLFLPFSAFTPYVLYLSLIVHYFIAGISMFFLAKRFTGSAQSGLLSAFAYMYSGFMIGHFQHVTMIEVMAWFPLVFLLLDKSLEEGRWVLSVSSGLVLGVSILAGHPQTSHAMIFVLTIHVLYRGGTACRQAKKWNQLLFPLAALAICLSTGFMLAAVQLLPTWELTREAVRGTPVSFQTAAQSGQFSWSDLISMVIPNYFGAITKPYWGTLDISQSILYMGTVPFLFGGYAVIAGRKSRDVIYCFMLAGLSLLLALGEHGPLFRLFYGYVPGFSYFRSPAHTVFICSFFMALLAGYGFRDIVVGFNKIAIYGILIGCLILSGAIFCFGPTPPIDMATVGVENVHHGLALFVGTVLLVLVIIFVGIRFPKSKSCICFLLLVVSFADLYWNHAGSVTSGTWASPMFFERVPTRISRIRESSGIITTNLPGTRLNESELQNGLFRIYTRPEGVIGTSPFGFNRAMLHRTFMVEGFEPLELSRHRQLESNLSTRNIGNLLKVQNVKYVSSLVADGETFEEIPPSEFMPRAFVVANARFMALDGQVLEAMATFDPRNEVLISGEGEAVSGNVLNPPEWSATVEKYGESRVEIRAKSSKGGFLVLSDTFYPGWSVTIDGEKAQLLRANYNFRAVALPVGEHVVVFNYFPRTLVLGGVVSIITLLSGLMIQFQSFRAALARINSKLRRRN